MTKTWKTCEIVDISDSCEPELLTIIVILWEWHWTAFVIIWMFLKSLGLILRQQCTFANDTLNVNAAKLKVLQKESKNCLDMICMQCIYITQLKLQDIRSKTPGAMKWIRIFLFSLSYAECAFLKQYVALYTFIILQHKMQKIYNNYLSEITHVPRQEWKHKISNINELVSPICLHWK